MKKIYASLSFCLFAFAIQSNCQPPTITYQAVVSGLTKPVKVVNAGDGRLFIGENTGSIKVFSGGKTSLFLDLSSKTDVNSVSGGFLSVVFHPNYKNNGYFFVLYTEKSSPARTSNAVTLARYHVSSADSNLADPASEKVILRIQKPLNADSTVSIEHNGSDLYFGRDGNLYISVGDGMSAEPADPLFLSQNVTSLFGKMLRINVNNFNTQPYYTIPLTNPFNLGAPNNARKEIYSTGLRNPFRWSFDRLNGDMYIGDVGQNKWEEVDYTSYNRQLFAVVEWAVAVLFQTPNRRPVANYGWSCYEGNDSYVNVAKCTTNAPLTFPVFQYPHPTTGIKYAAITGGMVYRGTQYSSLYGYYMATDFFTGDMYFLKKNSSGQFDSYVQKQLQGGITGFGEDVNGEMYVTSFYTGQVFKITVNTASLKQSGKQVPVMVENTLPGSARVYPSVTSNPSFSVSLNKPATLLQVVSVDGGVLYQKSLKNMSGTFSLDIPGMHKGLYLVKIISAQGIETHKVILN